MPDPINHPEYVEEEEITAYPEGHTIWDSIECRPPNGDFTVQEFKDWWQVYCRWQLTSKPFFYFFFFLIV